MVVVYFVEGRMHNFMVGCVHDVCNIYFKYLNWCLEWEISTHILMLKLIATNETKRIEHVNYEGRMPCILCSTRRIKD